jgi:hypothetical protein
LSTHDWRCAELLGLKEELAGSFTVDKLFSRLRQSSSAARYAQHVAYQ